MHIKQITVSNFRSFKSQPEIQPFSPHANCVVGRNGSGKSNLFDAVQFVLLAPKFYSLRTEERRALLHEGGGSAAVNAFVEIVFDNSDNRFNIESTTSDEVVLRRTIGHKKDEFFLQRKRALKSEIMSLLEGAGFSKSNPYFIVQQGKVNALCTMSDEERLELLKEVAGTTVYDEKKSESLAKMTENDADIEKICEILTYIDERLQELEGEKEELTAYQKLDRSRRAVEFALYDKELRKARETVDELEHVRSDEAEKLSQLHEEVRATHDAIRSAEATVKQKTNALRRNKVQLTALEEAKVAKMTAKTKLRLECKELEDVIKQRAKLAQKNNKELSTINAEIDKITKELQDQVLPTFDTAKDNFNAVSIQKEETSKKIDALYAKQNRGRAFTTAQERDRFLKSQIKGLTSQISEKERALQNKRDAQTTLHSKIDSDNVLLQTKKKLLVDKQTASNDLAQNLQDKKKARNTLADTRRDAWRGLDELQEKLSEVRDEHRRIQSELRKITPRATGQGLEALERIVREEGIPPSKYMGTIMQNLELKDASFRTAVEVAAGNSLHHVIVDSDATAAHLMQKLERGKLGRVTFLPLNQLHIPPVHYPDSPDVAPLLSRCISHHPRVERAMLHVFGKKLLARSVEVASDWSQKCDMDAITLLGDLCSRKGALTGGFVDTSKSKLGLFVQTAELQTQLDTLLREEDSTKKKNSELDQDIASVMGEMQRIDTQRATLNHEMQRLKDEIMSLQQRMTIRKHQVEELSEEVPQIEVEVKSLEIQVSALNEEMGTELSSQLTEEERSSLETLKKSQKELEKEVERSSTVLEEASLHRQRLQSYLDDNLLRRKKELEEEMQEDETEGGEEGRTLLFGHESVRERKQADLEVRRKELEDATADAAEVASKLSESKSLETQLQSDLHKSKTELEQLKAKDAQNRRALEDATESGDRLLNKRSMNIAKRENYMRKIQELGSLPPSSELSSHASLSIPALMRKLEGINKQLKKYSHVNKKAYDQYVNFSEQREQLINRKTELDQGAEKVRELVESLDRQKDEAINRTFRGVSAHFKDVFKELVPNGYGELIMKTALPEADVTDEEVKSDSEGEYEEESSKKKKGKKKQKKGKKKAKKPTTVDTEYDPDNPDVNLYRGVGVKVRFSPVGENYLMSQLSGGQKALVALGLIFAIQRCDPAPFYLFDELDQALDSTYRAAVAALIQRQANSEENPTQFICSTFRPELVSVANRCYGISHQNKVSNLHLLSKQEALHFIANLMTEEEAVGEVTTLSKSRRSSKGSSKRLKRSVVEESEEVEDSVTAPSEQVEA